MASYEQLIREGRNAFQRALAATDSGALKRLEEATARIRKNVDTELSALQRLAKERGLTPKELAQSDALKELQGKLRNELRGIRRVLTDTMEGTSRATGRATSDMIKAMGFGRPDPRAVQAGLRFLDKPEMKKALEGFAEHHVGAVGDIALRGIAIGQNPYQTAAQIAGYIEDAPRADALRFARTFQIWSVREGTLAGWRSLPEGTIKGWVWISARDKRCCMSCIALHGSIHKLDETLNDHHQGRCTPGPITPTWAELGFEDGQEVVGQTGEQWFRQQPDRTQIEMMGRSSWLAWKDGAFRFGQLSATYQDDVYGQMRKQASLTELVGEQAAKDWQRKAIRHRGMSN